MSPIPFSRPVCHLADRTPPATTLPEKKRISRRARRPGQAWRWQTNCPHARGTPDHRSFASKSIFPSFADTDASVRLPVALSALVRKMRSPETAGDECPAPGSSTFHRTSASETFSGRFSAAPTPEPFGPRKRGHSGADAAKEAKDSPARAMSDANGEETGRFTGSEG
jgi:hypothetical protein